MTESRDPLLESLFDGAREALPDQAFTAAVAADVRVHRRRVIVGRLLVAALLVVLELALDSPLQASLGVFGDMLVTSIYPIRHEWLAFVLAPVNTVAGLLGLLLLVLHYVLRALMR